MAVNPKVGPVEGHVMFPTPLMVSHVTDCDELNAALTHEARARRDGEEGMKRSNRAGWHSTSDLFRQTAPAQKKLAEILRLHVENVTRDSLPKTVEQFRMVFDGWININPTAALNMPHDHPGSFWSGTYYVATPPARDADDQLSGAIEFLDPRGSIGTNALIETAFTRNKFTVRPVPGMLLLWPSFVKHWVYPNQALEDRISVSFNAWFELVS